MFEIEARNKRKSAILFAILASILPFFLVRNSYDKLFSRDFSSGQLIGLLLFFLFGSIALFWLMKFFDSSVQLQINKKGVLFNKFLLPFSAKIFVKYSEIEYFYLRVEHGKGLIGHFLILGFNNEARKEKKIEISGLDKSVDEIFNVISHHAKINGIRNSGTSNIH